MKLKPISIIAGVLGLGAIVNLLFLFDFQYYFVRTMLSFILLIIAPGVLALMAFRVKTTSFWEYLVYCFGIGIATVIFLGLSVNFLLPALNITDKPLLLRPLIISYDILLLILAGVAYVRNKVHDFVVNFPRFDTLNTIFFVIPALFPLMMSFGATILNNGGSNLVSIATLGAIFVYALLIIIFRKKLLESLYPYAIWMISLAVLLMGWLRSYYVSGADINIEYQIFQNTKYNYFWSTALLDHAYNACLSVTILPTVLSQFLKINDVYIFKLVMPLLFSITPVVAYLFLRKYTTTVIAFLAVLFFMAQPTYLTWWWLPVRQEMALLFFALSLYVLFDKNITTKVKNILFLFFIFAMILCHYSTTYIALGLYLFTYCSYFVFRAGRFFVNKIRHLMHRHKLPTEKKKHHHNLNIFLVVLPIIFAIFWYSQMTTISNNFVNVLIRTYANLGKMFDEDSRAEGASFASQFTIASKPKDKTELLKETAADYKVEYREKEKISQYAFDVYKDEPLEIIIPKQVPPKFDQQTNTYIFLILEGINKLVKGFVVLGCVYMLFFKVRHMKLDDEYRVMLMGGLVAMMAIIVLPFVSIEYDLMRQYQQLLLVLALPAIVGGMLVFKVFWKLQTVVVAMVILIFFMSHSGFIGQMIGGTAASLQLNNFGDSYDQFYVHKSDEYASDWLQKNRDAQYLMYADNRASFKMWYLNNVDRDKLKKIILPSTIDKNGYVYANYANIVDGITYMSVRGDIIIYNFPKKFLEDNKDIIYSNGKSNIYK